MCFFSQIVCRYIKYIIHAIFIEPLDIIKIGKFVLLQYTYQFIGSARSYTDWSDLIDIF